MQAMLMSSYQPLPLLPSLPLLNFLQLRPSLPGECCTNAMMMMRWPLLALPSQPGGCCMKAMMMTTK